MLRHTYEALGQPRKQLPILLEAPTGSGKTVMMAAYLERLVDELPLQPGLHDNVAYIWFAPNTLHIQSFQSLQKLYADNSKLNCIDLSNLSGNPVLNPKDLLFVNWSSLDSQKKIWRRENETSTNLETLIENTRANNTKIILVIDEAHLSAFTGAQATSVRNLIKAEIELLVTATPGNNRPQRSVYISRQEVIKEQMIKKGVRLNIGLDPEQQNGENVHVHLLRTAFAKKEELKKLYATELGENVINPLLLIQLPSDNASLSEEDKTIRDTLVGLLNADFGITTANGRLAVWLSGERVTDGLEAPNGLQDVLIFKQAIAQGWDCPRAAVLVSYRTVQSPDFGVQTVGRILRMPHQRHYNHDELNYGYVFTNIESSRINFVPSDSDYFDKQVAERVKQENLLFDTLTSHTIINDRASKGALSSAFETVFFNMMEKWYSVQQIPDLDLFTPQAAEKVEAQRAFNKQAMIERGWEFTIDEHQIAIPTDIEVDPYEVNAIVFATNKVQRFAITVAEFKTYFDRFCYDNITRLNRSKSWKKLRETLLHFAEYYLGMYEVDARKFYLYPQNKALLVQHIVQALERFEAWQAARGNENRRVEPVSWEVPEIRYYSDVYVHEDATHHALEPFFEYRQASSPERMFKDFLAQHAQSIDWWYKNGDQGKEHFAVSYTDLHGRLSLFYVDFVVKFCNGQIGLFDTKTKNSDPEAANKHNALIAFMEQENADNPHRLLCGGILIPEEAGGVTTFRFCRNRIENTHHLTGWEFLNPMELANN